MRTALYTSHGKPEQVLQVGEVDAPASPGPCEVLVRVLLRPVHHGDLLNISGRYRPGAAVPPGGARPGLEGFGIVEQAGECVHLKPGTRVAFFPGAGAWGEKTLVPAEYVTEIPDEVSDEAAAQLHVNPLTAALLLRAAEASGAKAGQDVVVLTAAGGAVARLTISLLLERGYDVIGLVRREAGVNELNMVFPDLPAISSEREGWQQKMIAAAAGQPIGVVLDPVGGETAGAMAQLLGQGGNLIVYGNLSGAPVSVPGLLFPTRDLHISGVTVGRWAALPAEVRKADIQLALELAEQKADLFPVEATYDLADIGKAVAHAEAPGRAGMVLLASR